MRPKKICVAMAVCLITAGFMGGSASLKAAAPGKVAKVDTVFDSQPLLALIEEQLAAIRAGKIDKAYQEYTSVEFRKSTSLEQFKQLVNNTAVISKNKSFQFYSFYIENDIATFQGILISSDGANVKVEYDLIQEGDKWKIYGLQLVRPEMTFLSPESL